MGWLGSPSYFSRAHRRQPQPCRRRPSATCPHQPLPPAQGGRGEPSPWMGWNQKEQFSLPPSRGRLKENLWRAQRLERAGREGSSSTGSPPPPPPPPPPSPPPSQFQVHYAHRLEQASADRFEKPQVSQVFPSAM